MSFFYRATMASITNDLRYGLRMVRKQPASSATAIIALALGIGLTALMFSIVYGAILRGLPFDKPQQIVRVGSTLLSEGREDMGMRIHDLSDIRARQHSFVELGGTTTGSVNLSDGVRPERFEGAWVTPEVFGILGAKPALGRVFGAADGVEGAPDVVIIDYDTWQTRFEGRADAIGGMLRVNGKPATVVGVMPDGFAFPETEHVWLPFRGDPLRIERGKGSQLDVVGRLRDGVSVEAARVELASIAAGIAAAHPDTNKGIGVTVLPYVQGLLGKEPVALLFTMLGAVFMVLVIACTNVANLLIARSAGRSKEVAVRSALGASRLRVIRQFLAESMIIAFAGAALGVGIAFAGSRMFMNAIADTNPPFWIDVRLDSTVLLFVLAITIVATLLSGTFPAINASKAGVGEVLKDEARGSSSRKLGRVIRALVVIEISLSAGLLVGAGLMIRSVTQLRSVDLGIPTEDVFTARVSLSQDEFQTKERRIAFYEELATRLGAIPGVRAAALAAVLPTQGAYPSVFEVEGKTYQTERDRPRTGYVVITPTYFDVIDVTPTAGRVFTTQDRAGSMPVALVTQDFARRYFGTGSAVGRRVKLVGSGSPDETARTIVGVVPDNYVRGLANDDQSAVYIPFAQAPVNGMSIMARVTGPATGITPDVRAAVAAISPDQPIFDVESLRSSIDDNNWFYAVFGSLFVVFGAAALFLASVGLYGVMSTSVNHRRREMGVRMAMGANSRDVLRLVMNEGVVQLALGLGFGLAFALLLSRLLGTLLFKVDARDPITFVAIAVVLIVTAMTATLIPATRAARVQPVEAMRD